MALGSAMKYIEDGSAIFGTLPPGLEAPMRVRHQPIIPAGYNEVLPYGIHILDVYDCLGYSSTNSSLTSHLASCAVFEELPARSWQPE